MIIALAKRLNNAKNTQKYAPTLKKIIESIFKIAAINNKKKMLWPIGCGVFHNDPAIVSSLFVHTIKQKKYHLSLQK